MFTKSIPIKLKAGPGDDLPDGVFVGYASVFNVIDSVGDYVIPTAFDKTLSEWDKSGYPLPILFAHDMRDPFSNLGHVLQHEVNSAGLKVTGQLDLENPHALQTYRLLKGKRIGQMSFAYDEIDSGPATHDGEQCWELRELKLYEVSICQVGANQETEILAVKSLADRALWAAKVGRMLSAKNEGELRDAYEAIGRVLSTLDAPEKGKGFVPNPIRPSLLEGSDIKNVGEDASEQGPQGQPVKEPARPASPESSATAAKVRNALLDIELLEGAVA